MNKKTILFTIELSERELFAKVLLALEMAKLGFRIYIGSFRSIHEVRGRIKSCIFFHKSGYRRRIRQYKRQMGATVAVLDEEMGVAIPASRLDNACAFRYGAFDKSSYDFVFTIGEGHKKRLEAMENMAGINIVPSGWPRIDLWREEYQGIHRQKTEEIRQGYGEYLLFISSFGYTSEAGFDFALSNARSEVAAHVIRNTRDAFGNYVGLLKRLAEESRERIIIRPHTSESLDDWRTIFADHPNVEVIREGDVTPWLLAASGVIAYRSTVVLQAALNGIPTVQYKINQVDGIGDVAVFKVSKCANTFEEVMDYLRSCRAPEERIRVKELAIEALKDDVSSMSGETAAHKIAAVLGAVNVKPQPAIVVHPVMRAMYYSWDRYKYLEHLVGKALFKTRASYRPSRFDKVPNGIKAASIMSIVNGLREVVHFDEDIAISCLQVSNNLVVLECGQEKSNGQ